jgi:hypothetical protein
VTLFSDGELNNMKILERITFKAIKHSSFASRETLAFEAKMYVDGKPHAIVMNDGSGGCHRYHPATKNDEGYWKRHREIEVAVAAESDEKFEPLDSLVNDAIQGDLTKKDFLRDCRKGLVFRNRNQIMLMRAKGYSLEQLKLSLGKYEPDAIPLNDLDISAVLKHYGECTAPRL